MSRFLQSLRSARILKTIHVGPGNLSRLGYHGCRGPKDGAALDNGGTGRPLSQLLKRAEWDGLYEAAKKLGTPAKIFLFTNRGLELAGDSKPDELCVIRVPEALVTQD